METLVSARELSANLDNPAWLVFDCRFVLSATGAGEAGYEAGHIPGAFYISLDKDLSTPHIPGRSGRHPLPEKSAWIGRVRQLGITPDKQVVLYDDTGGAIAGRMWWMLRWIGHANAALLDGGLKAWQQAGLPLTTDKPVARQPGDADYAAMPALVKILSADAIDGKAQLLLDARELPRFRGDTEPLDPVAGHIPGALCSPFSANLDADGRFKSPQQLREKFAAAAGTNKPVVCYCGSGVTAAHNILAMKIAGLEEPALYPGSWSDWITDPRRPVATGE